MNDIHDCAGRSAPRWAIAAIIFASGLITGQALAQIVAKLGWF